MSGGRQNRAVAALGLVGLVLACVWWDYNKDGPGVFTGVALMIAPILAGAIFAGAVPKSPVKFGLSLAATGFVFAVFSVPMVFISFGRLGTAGLWLVIFAPIAVASVFAMAYGLLLALFGSIYRSNKPVTIEPAPPPSTHS